MFREDCSFALCAVTAKQQRPGNRAQEKGGFGESSPAGGRVWQRREGLIDQTEEGESMAPSRRGLLGTHCAQRDGRELGESGCGEFAPQSGTRA